VLIKTHITKTVYVPVMVWKVPFQNTYVFTLRYKQRGYLYLMHGRRIPTIKASNGTATIETIMDPELYRKYILENPTASKFSLMGSVGGMSGKTLS
jgi:hypothetical protein